MRIKLLLASNLLFVGAIHAQETAKGFVYHDINKNGKRDKNEIGISNVSVSNGIQVVQTDEKGAYKLPVGNDNIIFVVKPAEYELPLKSNNQPTFYYIHKPIGSPELKYKGVEATGALPKSIDFGMLKTLNTNETFKAFVFGDPQAYTLEEIAYFKTGIIDAIKDKQQSIFGISLGDLVGDDLSLHQPYLASISKMGMPWYNVIGNHDMNYDVQVDSLSDETFEKNFGPANYSFNYGKAHFIVLDNILYPNPRTGKGYLGGFRKDQLDFIENDLKFVPTDKLIVLVFHIPLLHKDGDVFRKEDRDRLFNLLAKYPNTLSLSAHTHYQQQNFYDKNDGWQQDKPHHEYNVGTTSGDWYSGEFNSLGVPSSTMRDGTPKGYAILNIDGNKYSFDYRVAGENDDYQIKLVAPSKVTTKHVRRYSLYANFFMGTAKNVVEYRINDGEWKKMLYNEALDPAYNYELLKFENAKELIKGRRPSDAVVSKHLWSVKLPKLEVGTYQLEVRAKDIYGKVHQAKQQLDVVQ